MQRQSIKNRKGDTNRTSSQGRKQSSGGTTARKKGNPDRNENTGNNIKYEKPRKLRIPAKAIVR